MPTLTEKKRPATRAAGRPAPELIFGDLWEYDPAPETADPKLKPRYDLFIGGKFVAPASGKYFDSINPANEQKLAEIAHGGAADVDAAYAARSGRSTPPGARCPGKERGKYLYRIARLLQDRAREFAVAETMDGGKPIKESRDFDVPMAAAHFFYHAGWADKLEYVAPGRKRRAARRRRPGHPVEFPAADARVEDRPGARDGQLRRAQAGRDHPHHRAEARRDLPGAGLPPGVVNIVTGAGRPARPDHDAPDVDKVAFTGSTEVGKIIMRSLAGTDKKLTLELGGKAANIVFDDAPLDQAVEGIVNGIFFNQGHVCCAGSRLLVQERSPTRCSQAQEPHARRCASAIRSTRTPTSAPSTRASSSSKISELVASGVKEGATLFQPACKLPAKGFWFRRRSSPARQP
jgi:aldehyde dehydrogenase (NAD+)